MGPKLESKFGKYMKAPTVAPIDTRATTITNRDMINEESGLQGNGASLMASEV